LLETAILQGSKGLKISGSKYLLALAGEATSRRVAVSGRETYRLLALGIAHTIEAAQSEIVKFDSLLECENT
jgi:hypothetical protein